MFLPQYNKNAIFANEWILMIRLIVNDRICLGFDLYQCFIGLNVLFVKMYNFIILYIYNIQYTPLLYIKRITIS